MAGAVRTDSADNDGSGVDPAPRADVGRQVKPVNGRPLEVHYTFATAANQVVVWCVDRLKAGLAFSSLDARDKAMLFQGGQGPIDCVQRDRGQ